jgi:hypothetical protein
MSYGRACKGIPDLMINISASPFAWNRGPERLMVLSNNAKNINFHFSMQTNWVPIQI